MKTPLEAALALLSGALLLAGCSPAPAATPTDSGAASPSAPSAEPTEPTPGAEPSNSPQATVVGTCTADADHPTAVIYVVTSDDAITPISIQYTAFNADGSYPVVTETVVGPVVTRVSYPCRDYEGPAPWTFIATMTTSGSVGCLLGFGGLNVRTNSSYAEHDPPIPISADCSGQLGV
jgi:hypothetical protein